MDFKVWVIIGLLFISYMQYAEPEKANGWVEPVWGEVQSFLSNNNPINTDSSEKETICPDIENKVCGSDGSTYLNSCEAAVAGILEVTPGECEE